MIKLIPLYKVQCIYATWKVESFINLYNYIRCIIYFQQEDSIPIKERKIRKTQIPWWSKGHTKESLIYNPYTKETLKLRKRKHKFETYITKSDHEPST